MFGQIKTEWETEQEIKRATVDNDREGHKERPKQKSHYLPV